MNLNRNFILTIFTPTTTVLSSMNQLVKLKAEQHQLTFVVLNVGRDSTFCRLNSCFVQLLGCQYNKGKKKLTCHGKIRLIPPVAQIAQSVEQRIENPRVGGSIPPLGTIIFWCVD